MYFGRKGGSLPVIKTYLSEAKIGVVPRSWWPASEVGSNQEAKRDHLRKLFPDVEPFATPKPERLLQRVVQISTDPGDLVLDCFAGSGTTAAVAHKVGRRWVTSERETDAIEQFTRPRLEKVVAGEDPGGITAAVEWTGGGGFRHLRVGQSMFDLDAETGEVFLAEWATNGAFSEAVAAQLGFERMDAPPFCGRKGRTRLAVLDGVVGGAEVEFLVRRPRRAGARGGRGPGVHRGRGVHASSALAGVAGPSCSPRSPAPGRPTMIVPYDAVAIDDLAARLDLRDPNRRAVAAVADTLDSAEPGAEIVCDLATATGKTYIAAGVIDYLAAAGVRNVLIVCPGTTILTKTVNNFTPGHAKFVAGLEVRPTVITSEDFARGSVSESLRSSDDFKLFVFNVQQLLRPTANTSRRVRDYDENLGASLYEHLRSVEDLVVIADEHHSYFGPQFSRAVRDLSPQALIGLTATPHPKTDPAHIVFHYPLAEAIADGYVKVPVLVARRDGSADIRRQLADGVILLKHKAAALAAYAAHTGEPAVNP